MLKSDGLIFFNICHYIRWRYRLQLRRRLYFLCKRFGILDYHLFFDLTYTPNRFTQFPIKLCSVIYRLFLYNLFSSAVLLHPMHHISYGNTN